MHLSIPSWLLFGIACAAFPLYGIYCMSKCIGFGCFSCVPFGIFMSFNQSALFVLADFLLYFAAGCLIGIAFRRNSR